jgi:RNA polymerase sigma factor (sigma-70 family)
MDSGFIVFLVDDDPSILKSLTRVLAGAGYETKIFLSATDFLEQHDTTTPGCAIIDLALPGMSGLRLQRILAEQGSRRQIIFLSGQGTIPATVDAIRAGAVDFLTKPVSRKALVEAIEKAATRDEEARQLSRERETIENKFRRLTPRENEVLTHVIGGWLNKQIAARLGTVEKTVKVHRSRLMAKIGARSVADLVRMTEAIGIKPYSPDVSLGPRANSTPGRAMSNKADHAQEKVSDFDPRR